jgi:pilus assembly protein Flp/PilA
MTRSPSIRSVRDFLRDERGATAIEYALLASCIAGAIITVVTNLGTTVQAKYQSVSDAMK